MGSAYSDEIVDPIDPQAPEFYCSKGFRKLRHIDGMNKLISYMSDLTDKPVVSVGSGSGYVEKYCLDRIENLQMTLIDPLDPSENNFCPVPEHLSRKPDYSTVSKLIESTPTIVGNCHLFLNWSLPNHECYDFDAIIDLQPEQIIICCEVSGSAGSNKMLAWLDLCGVDRSGLIAIDTHQDLGITGPLYHIDQSIYVNGRCELGWPTRTMLIKLSKI